MLFLGTMGAIIAGAFIPSISLVMGEVTNTFDPNNTKDEILDTMARIAITIGILGAILWVFGYIYYGFW